MKSVSIYRLLFPSSAMEVGTSFAQEGGATQAVMDLTGEDITSKEGSSAGASGNQLSQQADLVVWTNSSAEEQDVEILEDIEAGAAKNPPAPVIITDNRIPELTDVTMTEAEALGSKPPSEGMDVDQPVIRVVRNNGGSMPMGDVVIDRSEAFHLDESLISDVRSEHGSNAGGSSIGSSNRKRKCNEKAVIHSLGASSVAETHGDATFNIWVDPVSGIGSILDVLRKIDAERWGNKKAPDKWYQLKQKHSALQDEVTTMRMPGTCFDTPAAAPSLLCEIAYLALNKRPADRRNLVVRLCKSLSVDVSWIDKWDKKYSSGSNKSGDGGEKTHLVVQLLASLKEDSKTQHNL